MRVFARCIDGNRCGVRGRILIPACENRVLPLPRTVSAFELCGDGRLRPSYLHRFSGREMRQVGISIGRSSCARRTAEGGCPHMSISSIDFDWLVYQALVGFIGARQFEGVRQYCLPFFHAGYDVGANKPVVLGEVGLRPPGGVVGMGVVEADDVLASLAAFALDPHQFLWVDVVAVMGGVGTGIAAAGG